MTEAQYLIEVKLATDTIFMVECLLLLYARQENEEQQIEQTVHSNGVGFNKSDAPYLTSLAHKIINQKEELTVREAQKASRMLVKYAAQLSTVLPAEKIHS